MFTEGYSEEQLEQMNIALLKLLYYDNSFKVLKQHILAVKTVFFQPNQELIDLVKQRLHDHYGPRPYGFARYSTRKVHIERRLTHHYANGYSYLDEHEYAGRVEELSYEAHSDDDETSRAIYTLRILDRGDNPNNLRAALYDNYSGSHCMHDYDCCGCWTHRVHKVKHIHLGNITLYRVYVHSSRNY